MYYTVMVRIRLKVREIAIDRGFNQALLARKADVDFKTVKRLFQNPYRDVNISTLYKLARTLGTSVDELIEAESD